MQFRQCFLSKRGSQETTCHVQTGISNAFQVWLGELHLEDDFAGGGLLETVRHVHRDRAPRPKGQFRHFVPSKRGSEETVCLDQTGKSRDSVSRPNGHFECVSVMARRGALGGRLCGRKAAGDSVTSRQGNSDGVSRPNVEVKRQCVTSNRAIETVCHVQTWT